MPAYDFKHDGITQSLLHTWIECRQKAKLSIERWSSLRVAYPLKHGNISHSVMEKLHEKQSKNLNYVPKERDVVETLAEVRNAYENEHAGRWSESESEDFELICAQVEAVMSAYFTHWEKHPLKWVDIEGVFRVRFEYGAGKSTWLNGRFDGVYQSAKGLWLFDSKNKSRIDEEALGDTLLRDLQINFYLLALWKTTGKFPSGFIYNVIRRPGLKLGKSESIPGYMQRIRDSISEDPEHYFKRYEVSVDQDDLVKFEKELKSMCVEFDNWFYGGMLTWKYGMPCVDKYGMCKYVPVCYRGDYSMFFKRKVQFAELEEGK